MKDLVTPAKIQNFVRRQLFEKVPGLKRYLLSGDLLDFERSLRKITDSIYNEVSDVLLKEASAELLDKLETIGEKEGLKRLRRRNLKIQIGTGHIVTVNSVYAHDVPKEYNKPRHMIANYWTIISNSSLSHIDKVCMSSVLCPSYNIANHMLTNIGVHQSVSRVRKLTNDVGVYCKAIEAELSLGVNESLAGKRVVIGIDGGRTRTRIYTGQINKKGNKTYKTKWREPKLFVIHTLDKNGQLDINQKPIYGCRFGEVDILELLKQFLRTLQIHQSNEVQILADGAPWIWQHTKPLLIELGVDKSKITETLDYYHAISYVNSLVESLPAKYKSQKRTQLSALFKDWLWQGRSDKTVLKCNQLYIRKNQLVRRWINYLDKHTDRTQYADYQKNKLMCGSGIVESGIRRMINLKFKSPGTFWYEENVENLFFFAPLFFLIDGIFL